MIEKVLKTTEGKLKVRIPTLLDELTLGQMMQLQEKTDMDDLDAISILSGIPKEELNTVTSFTDFREFGDHIQSLAHQIKYLYTCNIVPDKVTFILDGRKVTLNVIHNLSVEPAGAFMAARDIISEEINEYIELYGEQDWQESFQPSLNACCNILAQYFYCRVTGKKYDEYEAEEFCEEVKKLRVLEAMPIAKHFFTCYPDLSTKNTNCFQRFRLYWKKRQVSSLLKNLSTSTRSIPLPGAISPNGAKY